MGAAVDYRMESLANYLSQPQWRNKWEKVNSKEDYKLYLASNKQIQIITKSNDTIKGVK